MTNSMDTAYLLVEESVRQQVINSIIEDLIQNDICIIEPIGVHTLSNNTHYRNWMKFAISKQALQICNIVIVVKFTDELDEQAQRLYDWAVTAPIDLVDLSVALPGIHKKNLELHKELENVGDYYR